MENLKIEATDRSPYIDFDLISGEFKIGGESRPENARVFYSEILSWMEDLKLKLESNNLKLGTSNLKMHFKFDYFNSTSAKYIFNILESVKGIDGKFGVNIVVYWHYKEIDEDMLESGQEFADMLDLEILWMPY